MTAADEARAEAERRWLDPKYNHEPLALFMQGAEWQASRDVVEVAALTARLAESERVAQVRLERLDQLLSESGSYDRARAASIEQTEANRD